MWPDLRAESIVLVRRPATWLLLVAAAGLTVTFGYAIPYAGLGALGEAARGDALGLLLPARFADTAIGGLPAFIGALALIHGVLTVGTDYALGTWKTILVQQPSRGAVLAGKTGVLAISALVLVTTLLVVSAVASAIIAALDAGVPVAGGADVGAAAWPQASEALADLAGGWLVVFMWAMLGAALAVVLRGVALPVGIGLVWMLAVQNLITVLAAPLLDWVEDVQPFLPGPAAGSLVASLGGGQNTLGVAVLASQSQALLVLAGYIVLFTGVALGALTARDLT
ncbi:hypothetical protein [Intrasporangium sp.]|uniref:hypothetical protein n=1 Tax=Intrasporangium sp. TaxID=1925024 RepID=UPI00293974AB|nr:hypothetical protein [Intrasporangium sp.]MDV3222354.1 hypothetical protein [Intrasporangium sp.]